MRAIRDMLLISLITFALGEVALRVYHHFHPVFIFYDDSYDRFRAAPHSPYYSFRLNSHGFIDVEFAAAKGDQYRIIGIGDSFAFGVVPYEHNYLTLLEEILRRGGEEIELVNMGIPSIGPKEYLALLSGEGLELDPDLVLLSFFIGNDFHESVREVHRNAVDYSYVASLLRYALSIRPHFNWRITQGNLEYDDEFPSLDPEPFLEIERWRSSICFQSIEKFTSLLGPSASQIQEISRICRQRKIAFVVILIPDEFQVNRDLQDAIIESLGIPREKTMVDFSRPNRMLGQELDALGIEYLDLLPAFADASREARYYRLRDTHWNIAGNELAAEQIAEYLLARRPPPR